MITPTPGTGANAPLTIALSSADLSHWLVLLLIAALAGRVIALLRGGAMPLGWVGGIGAALIGAWIGAELVAARVALAPQFNFDGVALVPAALGALVVAFVASLLTRASRSRY